MSERNKKIAFFYASRKIGGAQLLFARLAVKYLSIGLPVLIIDYNDGFLITYIRNEGWEPKFISFSDQKIKIDQDIVLVQHLSSIHVLTKQLNLTPNSTFIFWSIHPHNINALFRFTMLYTRVSYGVSKWVTKIFESKRRTKVKELLRELNNKKALYYMDKSNYLPSQEMELFTTKIEYMPISIIDKEGTRNRTSFDCINFAWIGRITGEKVRPFNRILKDLNNYKGSKKIRFHIIGYGDLSILKSKMHFEIIDHGIKSSEELNRLLLTEIDCVFAMGTSVLESSMLSIPSILCDVSKKKMPKNYKYKWLFETTDYSLGTEASLFTGNLSGDDIIDSMSDKTSYFSIGNQCLNYAKKNHSLDAVSSQVQEAIDNSDFTMMDLKKYFD
jgi:hypothetical protein